MDSIEELPKRIIEFRGFSKELDKFVYGDLLHLEKDFVKYMAIVDWSLKQSNVIVETSSIGQFTNEYYSDGTEVYEGDIYEYSYEYDSDYDGDMPIVKKSIGKGLVKHIFDTWQILEAKKDGGTVKVIGNIYQNSDLL